MTIMYPDTPLSIEPWYGAYAILGASTAGLAVICIPLVVAGGGEAPFATAVGISLYNFAGRLTARRGPATVLGIGIGGRMVALAGLAAVAYFLHPAVTALPVILLFGIYQGIWPLLSVASNDLAAGLAPFGEGAAIGLFNAVAAIASAVGAIVGGKVAYNFGYPAVSLFAAFGALLALAWVAFLVRR